jgi:hypothetical protein
VEQSLYNSASKFKKSKSFELPHSITELDLWLLGVSWPFQVIFEYEGIFLHFKYKLAAGVQY